MSSNGFNRVRAVRLHRAPPTQDSIFTSIRTLMSGQKKGKKVLPYFVRKYALYTITIK